MQYRTRQPALIFATSQPSATFSGWASRGDITPKFELGQDFCTMHLPQVSSSYVYSFGSYLVDKQTYKHTHKNTHTKTNKQTNRRRWKHWTLCYAMTLGNNQHLPCSWLCQQESTEDICKWRNVMEVVDHNDRRQTTRMRRQFTVDAAHNLTNILLYVANVLSTRHKCHNIVIFHIFTTTPETSQQAFEEMLHLWRCHRNTPDSRQ